MWTIKLLNVNQIPIDFREQFIVSNYRPPGLSLVCCVKSLFQKTNETLNFWTHFLPLLYFVYKLFAVSIQLRVLEDRFTWPLVTFIGSLCICFTCSSVAHAFNCLSEHARHVCFFVDYAGVFAYVYGTAIGYYFYAFPEWMIGGTFHRLYPYISIFLVVTCTLLACCSRLGDRDAVKYTMRVVPSVLAYVIGTFPVVERISDNFSVDGWVDVHMPYIRQIVLFITSAVVFSSHLPECIAPGQFDFLGHSHQYFHILIAFAGYEQMNALTLDMNARRGYLEEVGHQPTLLFTFGLYSIALAITSVIIFIFSVLVTREELCRKYAGKLLFTEYKLTNREEPKSNGFTNVGAHVCI